jgi:hypothetical protein
MLSVVDGKSDVDAMSVVFGHALLRVYARPDDCRALVVI